MNSEDREDAGEDGDRLLVLGEVEVLVGGVIQGPHSMDA
jgi:hypothetical protein